VCCHWPKNSWLCWEHQKLEKAFVDAGFMIDRTTKTCPDIYQMMKMCGNDFEKMLSRREAFIINLENVIAEHIHSSCQ
jgi:hypothetical protein